MENKKEQTVTIKIELDTTDVQKELDEIDERIRNSESFKMLNGEVFIKPALIQAAKISSIIESAQPITNTYNINIGKLCGNEPAQNKVTVSADKFSIQPCVDIILESIMEDALASHEEIRRFSDVVRDITRETICKESKPGGLLWRLKRG